jgi:hypothetical protein
MNSVTLDDAASLLAAWPLVLLALVIGSLVGTAFVRAGRPSAVAGWTEAESGRACRSAGHHYLKDAAGWCCSHCGDEIVHPGHAGQLHGSREAVAV